MIFFVNTTPATQFHLFFFFNDPPPTEIYPFPLHAALPIFFPAFSGSPHAPGFRGPADCGKLFFSGRLRRGPAGRPGTGRDHPPPSPGASMESLTAARP